jgi:hypothetical protein
MSPRLGTARAVRVVPALTLALLLVASAAGPLAQHVSAASTVFVDGKRGNDANAGTSLAAALKTVKAGMWALRYGGTLNVVGYDDYIYYETMTASQWFINGSATTPITIQAYGYGTAGAIRPIVSGAKVVSRPGSTLWTRPDAVTYPHVWQTPWTTAIPGYEASVNASRQERIFVDTSQPLVRPVQVPTLANLEATAGSQYWDGTKLFVHIGGWGSVSGASLDPNQHLVEIPTYKGLLVASGSAYVTIRGFRVRHTNMGVGFTGTATRSTAQDVDASYNYTMGFFTASGYNTFRNVSGQRNTLQLIKLDNGANHTLVDGVVADQNLGQGIKLTGANTAFNTVSNSTFRGGKDVPMNQGQYGGSVQGVDLEQGAHDNTITGNRIERNRRGLMLYQMNSSGLPLLANQVRYNTFIGNDNAVVLWDGRYAASQGTGALTFYRNTYWGNSKAIVSEAVTSNKTFDHETVYNTGISATVASSAVYLKYGSVKVVNSIFLKTAGYHFYAATGASIAVSYTAYFGAGLGARNSTTRVTFGSQVKSLDPLFLSVDPLSVDYLYAGPLSPVYALSSSGGPVGSRWR